MVDILQKKNLENNIEKKTSGRHAWKSCPKCHTTTSSNGMFCTYCGTKLINKEVFDLTIDEFSRRDAAIGDMFSHDKKIHKNFDAKIHSEKKKCRTCKIEKNSKHFSRSQWDKRKGGRCRICVRNALTGDTSYFTHESKVLICGKDTISGDSYSHESKSTNAMELGQAKSSLTWV